MYKPVLDAEVDTGEHPDPTELYDYCRSAADDRTIDRIERHLFGCSDCARVVARTVRAMVGERLAASKPVG